MVESAATAFDRMMREVVGASGHFGHREHVMLTWLAVRRHGRLDARRLVSEGLRSTAAYAGKPQKYNATVSRAWVDAVAHHVAERPDSDFDRFAAAVPDLLDKRLLIRFYQPSTLASVEARQGWVEPDRAAFPWAAARSPSSFNV